MLLREQRERAGFTAHKCHKCPGRSSKWLDSPRRAALGHSGKRDWGYGMRFGASRNHPVLRIPPERPEAAMMVQCGGMSYMESSAGTPRSARTVEEIPAACATTSQLARSRCDENDTSHCQTQYPVDQGSEVMC